MMMKLAKSALALLLIVMSIASADAQGFMRPERTAGNPGLKEAYQNYFMIGVAVNRFNITAPEQAALVKQEFNSMTAENDMKPGMLHPKEGVWNWGTADSIANFARQNGIKLRGHCLCWHSQFADWMFTDKKGKGILLGCCQRGDS